MEDCCGGITFLHFCYPSRAPWQKCSCLLRAFNDDHLLVSGCTRSKSILKGTAFKLPNNLSVSDYFSKCIFENTIHAESPAVVDGDGKTVSYTFGTLDSVSTKLAKALRQYLGYWSCNNPDGDLVMAFALPISENIPVILLAILKLGAAFLAIPPIYPEQLILKIVSVTRPMIVITESVEQTKARYDCVSGLVPLIDFDELLNMAMNNGFDDVNDVFPLEQLTQPAARMASIVYTAGTIDQQLAVRIGHKEILNRCLWQFKEFPYVEGEVQALTSGLEDVDSIAEIFAPLLAGFPLHLIPRKIFSHPGALIERIHDAKISRITLAPPSLAALLTAYEELNDDDREHQNLRSLKYCIVSGDALPHDLIARFFNVVAPEVLPPNHHHYHHHQHGRSGDSKSKHDIPVTLIHLYGSTEVMSDVTFETFENCCHLPSKFMDERVSIGNPISNTNLYIVDEDMRIVDVNVIGEICIAGASVASGGYVTGTEKDDTERFCINPFTQRKNYTTLYQTEDFGRIVVTADGNARLFYEGRTELTAKVKGKRIDLREISKLVNETKLVEQCFALCFHPGKIDQAIVAFCKLPGKVTQQELQSKLNTVIKEEHLMPRIFVVEQFFYLPSGRLDKHKLLKQYLYTTMNASPEEWQVVRLTPQQKTAAKLLFSAIAKYTQKTLKEIIDGHLGSIWTLGVDSLSALSIFLHIRESGFVLDIDVFLKAENLITIVEGMRAKTKGNHLSTNVQKFKLYSMPHERYYADILKKEERYIIIKMLSDSYAAKNRLCKHVSMSSEDIVKFLEAQWKIIIKDNLSLVAYENSDDGAIPVGAAIVIDAGWSLKCPSNCSPAIKYWFELLKTADKAPKDHFVWKKKGTVSQITFIGTAEDMTSQNNVLIVALLMEAAKVGAKSKGYNGTLVSCENPLVKDLCSGILNFKVLEEVSIYKFRSKDKAMPFRLLSEHHTIQVLYESF